MSNAVFLGRNETIKEDKGYGSKISGRESKKDMGGIEAIAGLNGYPDD